MPVRHRAALHPPRSPAPQPCEIARASSNRPSIASASRAEAPRTDAARRGSSRRATRAAPARASCRRSDSAADASPPGGETHGCAWVAWRRSQASSGVRRPCSMSTTSRARVGEVQGEVIAVGLEQGSASSTPGECLALRSGSTTCGSRRLKSAAELSDAIARGRRSRGDLVGAPQCLVGPSPVQAVRSRARSPGRGRARRGRQRGALEQARGGEVVLAPGCPAGRPSGADRRRRPASASSAARARRGRCTPARGGSRGSRRARRGAAVLLEPGGEAHVELGADGFRGAS